MCSVFRWLIVSELSEPFLLLAQVPAAEAWTAGNIVGIVVLAVLVVGGLVVAFLRLR